MADNSSQLETVKADLKVQKSRVDAYQVTCDAQGRKLVAIQELLLRHCVEAQNGDASSANIAVVHFNDPVLRAVANILAAKGSSR